jgi:hypothetical protein
LAAPSYISTVAVAAFVAEPSGHEHATIGQQRRGRLRARVRHRAGRRPRIGCDVVALGAREREIVRIRTAGDEDDALLRQIGRRVFAAPLDHRARKSPGIRRGIVDLDAGQRLVRTAGTTGD